MSEEPLEARFEQVVPLLCDLVGENTGWDVSCSPISSTLTTNYFTLKLRYEKNGKEGQQTFHIKKFSPLEGVHGRVLRFFYPKSNSALESGVLEKYREEGAPVPIPYKKGGGFLITEDVAGNPLEERFQELKDDPEARESLVAKSSNALCDLHETGRNIQFNYLNHREVSRTADLLGISELYCGVFCAEDDELKAMADMRNDSSDDILKEIKIRRKEVFSTFNRFFGIIDQHFSSQKSQLIHGDITTYHILEDPEGGIWFIDFGRPKLANPAFDLAPLYFSQDTNLSLEAIERVYQGYIERERRNLIDAPLESSLPEPTRETVDNKLKSLYLAGLFMDIRRASRSRFLKIVHPDEYQRFVESHPSYEGSSLYYKSSIMDISEKLLQQNRRFGIEPLQVGYVREFVRLVDKLKAGVGDCPPRRIAKAYQPEKKGGTYTVDHGIKGKKTPA
jgi:hypothetical protein